MNLHAAAQRFNPLIYGSEGINSKDNNGRTALSLAAGKGHKGEVENLLKKDGIEPNIEDDNGRTALSWAAGNGHTVVVHKLLDHGVEMNSEDKNGRTALSWAAGNGCAQVVQKLLSMKDININSKDHDDQTALWWAAANYEDNVTGPLVLAQGGNKWEQVVDKLLRGKGIEKNSKDKNGRTALSLAAENGKEQLMRRLLSEKDIDTNLEDKSGRTALSWAAGEGHKVGVEYLLKMHDIETDIKDKKGRTALSWAAENGHKEIVQELLKKEGIDINSRDENGWTALSWAARNGCKEVVQELLKRDDIDANATDIENQTALWGAIAERHIAMVELFTKKDNTTLRIAIGCKNHDMIAVLLKFSVSTKDVMASDWRGLYGQQRSEVVLLSEQQRQHKSVRRIAEPEIRHELSCWSAECDTTRSLFLVLDFAPWQNEKIPGWGEVLKLRRGELRYSQKPINGSRICFCVAVSFPVASSFPASSKEKYWVKRAIAWTMIPPKSPTSRISKSINHLSTLPYGWVPDDGVDFFKQFLFCLQDRWLEECDLIDGDLVKRRGEQLRGKGEDPDLIHRLAEDAQKLAEHHAFLADHVAVAKRFAKEIESFHQETTIEDLQNTIHGFSNDINHRIGQLDQTVRELLQFEFAWVSINEAHKSTSIATSMKRLSWITFIFLPAMFASSVFGMNVDLLKDNPDWRWYVLFGGLVLIITFVIWLVFKFNPNIESKIEHQAEKMFQMRLRKQTRRDTEKNK